MTFSSNSSQVSSEPDLRDALNILKLEILLGMHSHHIGTVQSFNLTNQTATATINYKKTYSKPNAVSGIYENFLVDYPILLDCPVVCLGGGSASLTFPIITGDECLVLFNDRDIDNWFQGNSNGELSTSRLHSFSDGIILVGIRSLANVLTSYDSSRAALRYGTTIRAAVGSDGSSLENGTTLVKALTAGVQIQNAAFNLGTVLQGLTTQLQNLTAQLALLTVTGVASGGGTSGVPANAAAIVAIGVNIATIATELGSVLQ